MRSQKLLIVSATMLACTSLAGVCFGDNTNTTTAAGTTTTPAPVTTGAGSSTTGSGASTATSQTVTNAPSATPTSTTTTTSADDATASSSAATTTLSPPPSGESVVVYNKQRPNKALLITGSALLVSTYVTTAALAAANGPDADKNLYIPVVGPWLNLADRTTASGRAGDTRDTVLIAGSGVLQGAGAALLITSFFVPEKVPAARISAGNVHMQLTPTAGPGAGGVGAIGTF
jgi:hypothetical protein